MAGLFSRLHIWNPDETLSSLDLNNEFNNILANVDAVHSEGYSQNLSQMQTQQDPGGLGTENLTQPISTADEIERLRFVIKRLIGATYWYEAPIASLNTLANEIAQITSQTPTHITSGATDAYGQPNYLTTTGGNTVTLSASGTPFVVSIDGQEYTFNSDIASSSLTLGFSSQHTATLADSFGNSEASRVAGEEVSKFLNASDAIRTLNLASVGTQISNRAGQVVAMKVVGTDATDFFIGQVDLGGTSISFLKRRYFFDSSGNPTDTTRLTTANVFTLLRITYVFILTNGTLDVTYNTPSYGSLTPSGAVTGDYWFDEANSTWKRYNGSSFVQNGSALIGVCAQDSTGCVVSRSAEFSKNVSSHNNIGFTFSSSFISGTQLFSRRIDESISVYGSFLQKIEKYNWDLANDLDPDTSSIPVTAWLYVSNIGDVWISKFAPIDTEYNLFGLYHPHKPYRCVGVLQTSGGNWDLSLAQASMSESAIQLPATFWTGINQLVARTSNGTYPTSAGTGKYALSANVSDSLSDSGTPAAISGLSVDLSVTGFRPVIIGLTNGAIGANANALLDANRGQIVIANNGGTTAYLIAALYESGNLLYNTYFQITAANSGGGVTDLGVNLNSIFFKDFPSGPGTMSYEIRLSVSGAGGTRSASLLNAKLYAYEIY